MVQSREEKAIYDKQYYKDHSDERKAYAKKFHKENYGRISKNKKQYYKDNREFLITKIAKYNKQYVKDHPEMILKHMRKYMNKISEELGMSFEGARYALYTWGLVVKKRDGHKCTWCNSTEKLVAHHIWHKIFCPESALDINNGITLCHECHKEQHILDRSFS